MPQDPQQQLARMQSELQALRGGALPLKGWIASNRSANELLAALPPRFGEVLHQLLDRLESTALFSEESCSFSQQGMLDSVQLWLEKAQARLAAG